MQRRGVKRSFSGSRGDVSSWKKFKFTPKPTASLTAKVNRLLSDQEKKNFDVLGTQTLVANTMSIIPLGSVAQGDDANSRDGRKIVWKSAQARYYISPTAAGAILGPWRVIILYDKQSNGVVPVAGDILEVGTNVLSPMTLAFKLRWEVLHDNYSSLGKGDFDLGISTADSSRHVGSFYKKLDHTAEYGGVGNVPITGQLYMVLISTNIADVTYYHRCRFTDS